MEDLIRTTPGTTAQGKPFDVYVQEDVRNGTLRLERISKNVLGTPRDLEIYRATRKTGFIADWVNSAPDQDYCCEYWADLRIGRGSCGYRCADCFLILTHRVKADPSRHILYENTQDFIKTVASWLLKPGRRRSLGLGIDCSDSLLYEGVTGYARVLAPLFADPRTNPFNRHLVLLTKSANIHYLAGLPTENVIVAFSLNPQVIADMFEGRYPDGLRITPAINERVRASKECERMGFETRWRLDPLIPVDGWHELYADFLQEAARCRPNRITLGIYRQMGPGLKKFSEKWGLTPMAWKPPVPMVKDGGTHLQLPRSLRVDIYRTMKGLIENAWPHAEQPSLALCKEVGAVRKASGITGFRCNCE